MEEQMRKPGAGIGTLGFFFTLLMVVALFADGLLLGLKTTIFKGSDMVDVLKNANLFETVTEVVMPAMEDAVDEYIVVAIVCFVLAGIFKKRR